jgi:hypothetical protein
VCAIGLWQLRFHLFVTGHGWGGDFSSVMGGYLGDLFDAVVSVFANGPYYLPLTPDAEPPCVGEVAFWLYHTREDRACAPEMAIEHRDFWLEENGCTTASASPLCLGGMVSDDECEEYSCSGPRTLFCSYTASVGRDIPDADYAPATVEFFRSLL